MRKPWENAGMKGSPQKIYYGFDYLRALMSIGVVTLHMELLGRHTILDIQEYRLHKFSVPDLLNYHMLCLAVPVFFLVSLFLFFEKVHNNRAYFWSRIERLIYIYVFWLLLLILWRGGLNQMLPSYDLKSILILIMSGGPSAFYFFFSLCLLTCISFFAMKLPQQAIWVLLATSASLLWMMPFFLFRTGSNPSLVAAWNPANFFVYVFIAILISRYRERLLFKPTSNFFRNLILFLFILFIAASVFEWHWMVDARNFTANQHIIPPYTRISVAVGSLLVFLLSVSVSRPPTVWIKFLSDNSLGLYCFHLFAIEINDKILNMLKLSTHAVIKFLFVLLVSYACSHLARRAFKKGLL